MIFPSKKDAGNAFDMMLEGLEDTDASEEIRVEFSEIDHLDHLGDQAISINGTTEFEGLDDDLTSYGLIINHCTAVTFICVSDWDRIKMIGMPEVVGVYAKRLISRLDNVVCK